MSAVFRLDPKGIRDIITSDWMRGEIDGTAEAIAEHVRANVPDDVPVEIDHYTTDRDAAAVTIADPLGMLYQARDGAVTRAAAAVGLEVRQP